MDMECHKKRLILKFYYLVGLNLLIITGNVSGQGFSHVADIFRILNHVEIPAIENFFPLAPPPFASFLGNDNEGASGEVDDIRLFVVDENNPTLKQEVSKQNYLSRMTGALRDTSSRTSGHVQGAIRDRVRHGQQNIRDGKLKVEEHDIKDGETDTDNEVELVEEATTNKPRNKLKIIVHGWGESASKSWYAQMTAAYMLKETEKKQGVSKSDITDDLKVLQVDWSVQAAAEYSIAARNTRRVGHYVGQFIADLYKDLNYALEDIHIIGHSLGGHVAGFIGKEVLRITGQSIGRITALDPAGPLFEGALISKEDRLTDSDAKLVDVVHTDGGFFGCKTSLGTIDFYPNGGVRVQPGCDDVGSTRLTMDDILEFAFCSHTRSYKYFIESIESNDVMDATKCDSWANFEVGECGDEATIRFGEDLPNNAERGSYFFKTNSEPPFTISDRT